MSNFGSYKGKDFFKLNIPDSGWLCEGMMKEGDVVMLVGDEKAGKTLITFQLICCLTSAHPFLDKYNIPKPLKVSYVQMEGKLGESQRRFNEMRKVFDFDENNFHMLYSKPINLEDPAIAIELVETIKSVHVPDVLILDPLYFALDGDLSDNKAVRRFLGSIRIIKEALGCAILWVHHTHKHRNTDKGKRINEGDEATFGSKFFKAYPDHTILFTYDKKREIRIMSCKTQRSGDIIEETTLKLHHPSPLYFEEVTEVPTQGEVIYSKMIQCGPGSGLSVKEIEKFTNLSRSTVYATLSQMIREKKIKKYGRNPVLYTIKELT